MLDKVLEKIDLGLIVGKFVEYTPNVIVALLLFTAFWILAVVIRKVLAGMLRKAAVPEEATDVLVKLASVTTLIIGALTAASSVGINVGALMAGLGIAGLAVSFAAQDTVANIISGLTLLIDRPFKKGDWIRLGDVHATVTSLRLRTSVLTTFDNETIVVPNKNLTQEKIVNFTLTPRVRCRVSLGIAYKEDTQKAREVMLSLVDGDERIISDPAPAVIVTDLGNSSVNMQLRFWTQDSLMKFPMEWEYVEKCKHALDEADIEIPFPHLQMFLERSEGLKDLVGASSSVS
jgi:small conductance mechanosensitive channel